MRILITGAPGWLGNRFAEILTCGYNGEGPLNDWQIRCLTFKNTNKSFIAELSKMKQVECIDGDVKIIGTLDRAFKDVDIVFHIAGIIHPHSTGEFYAVNTKGTENVLKKCFENSVKKIVMISSNSVAGMRRTSDLMKESDPPAPYMHYGRSKYMAEMAVNKYFAEGKLKTVILRPCWYYGPNQPDRQTEFFRMIKQGNPVVFGGGRSLRSMSFLDNTCQAMLLAAEKDSANGQTYWIADAVPYQILEIYRTLARLLGVKNFRPRYVPNLVPTVCRTLDGALQSVSVYVKRIHVAGEMDQNIACSIEKAQNELGYIPEIGLEEGMRRSIEWCRKHNIVI